MVFPRARMVVAAGLFIAWLCFLGYLVVLNRHMIVLSRPQFLAASLFVVGTVSEGKDGRPNSTMQVERVVWAGDAKNDGLAGKSIEVRSLPLATDGFHGAGEYILPLVPVPGKRDVFELTVVPEYRPSSRPAAEEVRIYPLTRDTEAQLGEIVALR